MGEHCLSGKTFRRVYVVAVLVLVVAARISTEENVDLVQRALSDSTFTWKMLEKRDVRVYYQPGTFSEKHRMMLLRSVTTAVDEVLEFLGEPEYDRRLHVFYLESREEMERITGRPVSGYSTWTASAVFVVVNPEWRSFETHEITHVFTMGMWGSPHNSSRWMIEGIAIRSDGWCREYTVDEIAFHLLSENQLVPLREFFANFAELGEIRAGVYAASIIGYIRESYGVEAVRDLWVKGSGHLTELLGADVEQIEKSWEDYLKSEISGEVNVDLKTIDELGCG